MAVSKGNTGTGIPTNPRGEGSSDEPEHWFGHTTINSMKDLREAAREIMRLNKSRCLEAFWLNTKGQSMRDALTRGDYQFMPFYSYTGNVIGETALLACSARECERYMKHHPFAVNPIDYVGRLALYRTNPGEPYAEEFPVEWNSSQYCMYRDILEAGGLLLSKKTADAARDCLVLCEKRSGLALPVPIGMTLEWRVDERTIDARTYCLYKHLVSDSANYQDMTTDPDPALLADEAVATEEYIVGLLNTAQSPEYDKSINFTGTGDYDNYFDTAYDDYFQRIMHIRTAYR